jgi:hypothetical protein
MALIAAGGGSAAGLGVLLAALRLKGNDDGDDRDDAPHRHP